MNKRGAGLLGRAVEAHGFSRDRTNSITVAAPNSRAGKPGEAWGQTGNLGETWGKPGDRRNVPRFRPPLLPKGKLFLVGESVNGRVGGGWIPGLTRRIPENVPSVPELFGKRQSRWRVDSRIDTPNTGKRSVCPRVVELLFAPPWRARWPTWKLIWNRLATSPSRARCGKRLRPCGAQQ